MNGKKCMVCGQELNAYLEKRYIKRIDKTVEVTKYDHKNPEYAHITNFTNFGGKGNGLKCYNRKRKEPMTLYREM
jgi:hypothetical protein